jgi:hypothetical protein
MVGDGRLRYEWDLESPVDHEVITEHSRDVQEHLLRPKRPERRVGGPEKAANAAPQRAALPAPDAAEGTARGRDPGRDLGLDLGLD